MDICPRCGVAVDVRGEGDRLVYVCRNPQCEQFGSPIAQPEGEKENE